MRATLLSTLLLLSSCATGGDTETRPTDDAHVNSETNGEASKTQSSSAPDASASPDESASPDANSSRDGRAETQRPRGEQEDETSAAGEFEGTTGVTEKRRDGSAPVVLREVRSARHEGFDRVVFEFDGDAPPGYRVAPTDGPVRQCGSGRAVALAGDARLHVRLRPAHAHDERGEPTVKERARRLSLPKLKELKLICDFEADVEWALGLASATSYRVVELRDPSRIVVDVKH